MCVLEQHEERPAFNGAIERTVLSNLNSSNARNLHPCKLVLLRKTLTTISHPISDTFQTTPSAFICLEEAAMAASSTQDDEFDSAFVDEFSCIICNEILTDPVQCQANEHYFCRECITNRLQNSQRSCSQTCPTCKDELTLETLRPAPRIIVNIVSKIKKPRCSFVTRGCKENVKVEEILLHQQTCGFAPVVCSNEGCEETMNRRDQRSHEREACVFRMTTCESCAEEMMYRDFEKHQCTLRREINEMKVCLDEINAKLTQIMATQSETLAKVEEHDKAIKTLQDPLHCLSSTTIQRKDTVVKGQIFVFGSHDRATNRTIEVFNWTTKTWTRVKDCLHNGQYQPFSFLYGNKIMISGCGPVEYINPTENGYTSTIFPCSCPSNGVLYGNRIIGFCGQIGETTLEPPYTSKTLISSNRSTSYCSVQRVGDRIYVVGNSFSSVELYDVAENTIKTLPSLPYQVRSMATVFYKDSLIIIGGHNGSAALNKVYLYNIHSLECKPLPSMREARSDCAAVIMGDVIVVMGGQSGGISSGPKLKTVEYYVIGDSAWQKLPSMHHERRGATACVYV